ncbi:alpha/beta hydrolase [Ruegeria sp. ANG-R]|uniref:COG3904 family protein n=1 Tax=Ruegeria sp. ANG-R TaxID=1577903 RepID=UPI00057E242F|nr:alpha/beta hydrolase [Ruegeria sp. ANG-R]KIC40015.1 alpha/beta hydrolase [Ruegeria sp. ANG-R]
MNLGLPYLAATLLLLAACTPPYSSVSFTAEGDQIVASGTIDHTTLSAFEEVMDENPGIKTLVLQNIEGSVDDDSNVVFSRVVREEGFDTVVPSDGLVASGGTDLFLAGNRRVLEPGACVGVHSWGGGGFVAAELPEGHPEHDRYLDYFEDIGVDPAFYWFTLEAASENEMHWMTSSEANRFDITTRAAPRLGTAAICDER